MQRGAARRPRARAARGRRRRRPPRRDVELPEHGQRAEPRTITVEPVAGDERVDERDQRARTGRASASASSHRAARPAQRDRGGDHRRQQRDAARAGCSNDSADQREHHAPQRRDRPRAPRAAGSRGAGRSRTVPARWSTGSDTGRPFVDGEREAVAEHVLGERGGRRRDARRVGAGDDPGRLLARRSRRGDQPAAGAERPRRAAASGRAARSRRRGSSGRANTPDAARAAPRAGARRRPRARCAHGPTSIRSSLAAGGPLERPSAAESVTPASPSRSLDLVADVARRRRRTRSAPAACLPSTPCDGTARGRSRRPRARAARAPVVVVPPDPVAGRDLARGRAHRTPRCRSRSRTSRPGRPPSRPPREPVDLLDEAAAVAGLDVEVALQQPHDRLRVRDAVRRVASRSSDSPKSRVTVQRRAVARLPVAGAEAAAARAASARGSRRSARRRFTRPSPSAGTMGRARAPSPSSCSRPAAGTGRVAVPPRRSWRSRRRRHASRPAIALAAALVVVAADDRPRGVPTAAAASGRASSVRWQPPRLRSAPEPQEPVAAVQGGRCRTARWGRPRRGCRCGRPCRPSRRGPRSRSRADR